MQIENNHPMPGNHSSEGGHYMKYPFAKMEVGDSILADGTAARPGSCKAYSAARSYGDKYGKKFRGRIDPDQPGKVRIWRTQ